MKPHRSLPEALLTAGLALTLLASTACDRKPGTGGGSNCNGICAVEGIPGASALSFGPDALNNPITLKLVLENSGSAPLNVTSASISGANASDFKLGGRFTAQIQVASSSSTTVVFSPTAAGTRTASVVIQTDGTPGTLNVPLTGVGVDVQICAQPSNVDFGNVQVGGTPGTQQVTISNCGPSPATVTFPGLEGSNTGDFNVTGASNGALQPGQAVNLTVTYEPHVTGSSTADFPYTTCSGCPNQTVGLTGVGVDGQLSFQPSPVAFPTQPAGVPSTVQVVGTNTGSEPIAVTQLGTYNNNSVFTLTGLPTLPLALAPQQTFSVTVNYDSTGSASNDNLVGVFTVADPTVAARTVTDPLSGNTVPAPCTISVAPSAVNFGQVPQGGTGTQQVLVSNAGGSGCQVSGIALSATTDPYYALGTGQATSFALAPGASQPVTITFAPTAVNPPLLRTGQLTFQSTDPFHPATSVPLSAAIGQASPPGCNKSDSYTVTISQPQVDLLWVMDNDDDEAQDQNIAMNALPAFFAAAQAANVDFHMAVTDTDICSAPGSDQGWFEPCANCQFTTNANATIVTTQTPNPVATLAPLLQMTSWNCASAGADEQLIEAAYLALQPGLLGAHNAGFLRDTAYLAILVVDGDDGFEDDLSTQSVQAYYTFFESLKSNPSQVSFSFVDEGTGAGGGPTPRLTQLVQMTGGLEVDTTQPSWATTFNSLWATATASAYSYALTGQPVATSFTLTVNGVAYPATSATGQPQWSYNPTTNSVVFVPTAAPKQGDVVAVTYSVACGG